MSSPYYDVADILEKRSGGNTWDDVLKVTINGAVYSLGDFVSIDGIGKGIIRSFRPKYVLVSPFEGRYEYKYIQLVSESKLNPNQVFKRKKRRMF